MKDCEVLFSLALSLSLSLSLSLCLSLSGHYVSDCSSQSDSCWLSYDDERVTMKTEERVVKRRQRSAYVLFYETK